MTDTVNTNLPDFIITSKQAISAKFSELGITTFAAACLYVRNLSYGRNTDKLNFITVFTDQCGTCSTKHALLHQLATENNVHDIKLMCGIYRMNGLNTPRVGKILSEYDLISIPEAHNYLKYQDIVFDFTGKHSINFIDDLLEEIEIEPIQVTDYKIKYHKAFLRNWLGHNSQIRYSLPELWRIREKCIAEMSAATSYPAK